MAAATSSGKGTVSPGHNHVFVVVFPKTSSSQGAEDACAGVSGLLPAQGCKLRGQRVLGIGIEPKLLALLSPRAQHQAGGLSSSTGGGDVAQYSLDTRSVMNRQSWFN